MRLEPNSHRTRHARGEILQRHFHSRGYTAVVLSGGYEEAGDTGRHRVEPGHVILHRPFESHLNRFIRSGAEVLVLTSEEPLPSLLGRVADPDLIARLAETDVPAAIACLKQQIEPCPLRAADWPDELALALLEDPNLKLRCWASAKGIHPASLCRGFRQQFGVSPAYFRCKSRFQRARELLGAREASLASAAAAAGYADQSHMTRELRRHCGITPSQMRNRAA